MEHTRTLCARAADTKVTKPDKVNRVLKIKMKHNMETYVAL
jgi:hypothetical protein